MDRIRNIHAPSATNVRKEATMIAAKDFCLELIEHVGALLSAQTPSDWWCVTSSNCSPG